MQAQLKGEEDGWDIWDISGMGRVCPRQMAWVEPIIAL